MFTVVARRVFPKVVASTPKAFAFRAFSEKLTIPTDNEQQYGRRKEEMEAEAAGDVGFNRDPIIPPDEAGTKENPILVSGVIANRQAAVYFKRFSHQISTCLINRFPPVLTCALWVTRILPLTSLFGSTSPRAPSTTFPISDSISSCSPFKFPYKFVL